jgi:hypothetical protein
MDKKKILDLIKLEVLRCLNDKDYENLQSLKVEEIEFPWKELGDYQNLIALLPLSLELQYPSNELKNKTAMKLYDIRDQIKAKLDARKAQEIPEPSAEEISLSVENVEEIEAAEQIEVEEKVLVEVEEGVQFLSDESITKKEESLGFVSDFKDKDDSENLSRHITDDVSSKQPPKPVVEKEMIEKVVKEYIKSHLEREHESLRSNINKNKILSIVLFVISLLLIVALFIIK